MTVRLVSVVGPVRPVKEEDRAIPLPAHVEVDDGEWPIEALERYLRSKGYPVHEILQQSPDYAFLVNRTWRAEFSLPI